MFEKEAEEYIKTNNLEWELECHRTSPIGEVKHAFLAGAEFGYNKAKEEMQVQGLALQSDMDKTIEQNIQLKKQIEKMKCCGNCEYQGADCEWFTNHKQPCTNLNKYQLRR